MRTAVLSLAGLAAATAVACAACATPPDSTLPGASAPATSPGVSGTTAPSSRQLTLPTVSPITPTGSAGTPTGVPAAAPPPDTAPSTYADPVTVTRAWFAQFCQTDYQEPANGNIARASVFATPAAVAADTAAGDTATGYQQTQEQKLATRCDGINVEVNPEAPARPDLVYVVVSATTTQLADGRPFQPLPATSTRRVVRGGDGRWLVDIAVTAG